ncbi:uncharacterized protein LOC126844889 isoform X2 [Adelges cooleyi]|uniref:uncharacterized protein LOC126844889 isoform X2 n=1 Tax=Adelges cooleyi TaxID=133065 RepID=UPI00217F529E|nr:uncharacterized protein LOC126844889 isoform X2 [Adelges cooleyi]
MPYNDSMFVPPWHVWSVDFINNEEWDQYKDYEVFTHPSGHERLPIEISRKVKDWKRPNELFGTDGLVILPEGDVSNVQNLLTVNKSLMNVKAYRWMLYHIIIYIRRFKNKWPIPWHPISNIFSRCKVTAAWNRRPRPVFNPFGKYWLKLYYMGEFRLICVSDHLPVGENGQVLLPLCENNKVLWLPLLVKGLLRIYALAGEFHQFNTITCLTGWTCVHEDCRGISKDDVWSAIMAHSPRPLSELAKTVTKSESTTRKSKPVKVHYEECYTVDNKGEKCFRGNDVSAYRTNPPNSIFTSIILSPNPFNEEGKRDPPLNRSEYDQPALVNFTEMKKNDVIPSWKAIRWTDWALENKVVKHHEVHEFRRTINMVTPCSLILEKSCQLKDVLQGYEVTTENNRYEMDFTYLEQFVVSMEIYFKKNQAFPFVESIVFPAFKNTEHCVYMQLESLFCESALFTLSTCINYVLEDGTMARDLRSSNYHNQIENPFIVVEHFYWPTTHLSKPTLYICFKSSSKDIIKFKPGINVLKIWGELPDHYSLIVESTVPFTIIQTEEGAYESLTVQPKTLKTFISNIQKTFNTLANAESHTGEHGQALMQFYSSFLSKSASLKGASEKAEICTAIRKHVLEAVLKWTEKNCLSDFTAHVAVEVFKEFQEMFQERNFGSERITQLLNTIRKEREEREELQRNVPLSAQPSKRSRGEDKSSIGAKKSQASKSKSAVKSSPGSPGNTFKTIVVQGLHENMLDIISDVLGQIGADEYPFEMHQLKRTVLITQEVDVGKVSVNSLLLVVFKFELNAHSLTEPGLTLILVSNKDGTSNDCSVNLDLFENGKLIQPVNQNGNMYSVCRADNGYTLIGWVSKGNGECYQSGYRVSFFGRVDEVLHTCSARKVELIHHCAGTNCEKTELASQHVVDVFLDLNPENVLARASLNIENAGSFSIYCRLSDVNTTLELRVMIKNKNYSIRAFARNIGDTVLLPFVYLDPIVILDNTEEDSFEKVSFVLEVVLIEPNNDIVQGASPKPVLGDWSIICVYDQKLTGVNLQVKQIEEYTYISSIPQQAIFKSQQPPDSNRYYKSQRQVDFPEDNETSATLSVAGLNHNDILKCMLIEQETMTRLIQYQDSKNFQTEEEQESILAETTYRQNVNEDLTKKIQDLNEENRKKVNDDVLTRVAKLFNIKPKSQINIKQSRVRRVKI